MKLTTKLTISMTAFGMLFILCFGLIFYFQARERQKKEAVNHVEKHMSVLSKQVRQLLLKEVKAATIMANAPLVEEALAHSNERFGAYSNRQRKEKIKELDEQWINAETSDPFILDYLNNPISTYFRLQQDSLPGEYGEIFLTNRYGATVATTTKLTTYYHENKYWWQGAFSGGEGKVFIDDRGFDTSVGGYVLGIVVPVQADGQIIGILKCNINIITFLETLLSYSDAIGEKWKLQISRSNGRIVLEEDTPPLSTTVDDEILFLLNTHSNQQGSLTHENSHTFSIIAPIQVTIEDSQLLFNGRPESIDHREGNKDEHWDFIAISKKSELYRESRNLLLMMVNVGFLFFFGMLIIAFIISRRLTRRLRSFVPIVEKIGLNRLDLRLPQDSNDEIGMLAATFNTMVSDLQKTLTSKKSLEKLIKEKDFLMRELNHRVKNNLVMINSLIQLKESASGRELDLSDLRHQIDAIRIVHEKLYKKNEITHIDMEEYIHDLIETIFSTFTEKPIEIDFTIENRALPTKSAIPLGLIINEIATNTIKYGFSSTEKPKFSIKTQESRRQDQYVLIVSNNGPPFPEDIDLDTMGTLGMQLISALVDQLDGTIELQKKPHPVFTICFPIEER